MRPEGPHINLTLPFFDCFLFLFVFVSFFWGGGGSVVVVGPIKQHQRRKGNVIKKTKKKANNSEKKLVFPGFGEHFWGGI